MHHAPRHAQHQAATTSRAAGVRSPSSRLSAGARGGVMIEFVLVMPLLMLVLALLFYFGQLGIQSQQATNLARYEVWRSATDAPGPAATAAEDLAAAFFPERPATVRPGRTTDTYPDLAYLHLLDGAEARSSDAGRLAWFWLHEHDGADRHPRGLHQQYAISDDGTARRWGRIAALTRGDVDADEVPLRRGQLRIRGHWPYVDDWRAAHPHWRADLPGSTAPTEAARDAFFETMDVQLEAEARAQASRTGLDIDHTFTGLMRTFYLQTPRYQGPQVRP